MTDKIKLTARQIGKIVRVAYAEGSFNETRGMLVGHPYEDFRDSIAVDDLVKRVLIESKIGKVYRPEPISNTNHERGIS